MNYTRINKAVNARISDYCEEMGISTCEIRLEGCMGQRGLL